MKPLFVYESVEDMLLPQSLTKLLGERALFVTRRDWDIVHLSGSRLQQVWVEGETGRARLVLKQLSPSLDWVMWLTHDTHAREVELYARGHYARMPREIEVPVLAVARNDATPGVLMRDVSSDLISPGEALDLDSARWILENLARLHLHFRNDSMLGSPALGLCTMEDLVTIFAPARLRAELDTGHRHSVIERALDGWRRVESDAPGDIQGLLRELWADPRELVRALEKMPRTLVHGDYKLGNLGLIRGVVESPRVILIDWQDAAAGPPFLDLGYFLALNGRLLPFPKEEAVEIYNAALGELGKASTRHAQDMALCVGGPLRLLWLMQTSAPQELEWWFRLIRQTF